MPKNVYRYKVDHDGDYKIEVRYWFFPLWWFHLGYKHSEERAKQFIVLHKKRWVYIK